MTMISENKYPVAIIGGGPIGLAAAAHLVLKGERFVIFEAGKTVGANMLEWEHVRMFSPWQYNVDKAARKLLEDSGWIHPNNEALPTGKELVEQYLQPLAALPEIKDHVIFNAKVVGVAKKGTDKLKTADRDEQPYQLYVEIGEETSVFEAITVIDASGTWKNPNPILSNGLWTKAERNLKEQIFYGIPNVLGHLKETYANKTIMVIGSGHSAINALLDLAKLKEQYTNTTIHWVLRKPDISRVYGGQEKDGLPARGQLGIEIQQLVESGMITVHTPFYISEVSEQANKIQVAGDLNGEIYSVPGIDEIIVSTGFRPNTAFLNEVRIQLDTAVESVEALAPLIDPNIHSCGTVRPHGEAELRQPEKGLYIVGIKSYGRAPTFLLATGYEQVRSVVAFLTGDYTGAKEVHLELPETGVCSTNLSTSFSNTIPTNVPSANACCTAVKVEVKSSSCCG